MPEAALRHRGALHPETGAPARRSPSLRVHVVRGEPGSAAEAAVSSLVAVAFAGRGGGSIPGAPGSSRRGCSFPVRVARSNVAGTESSLLARAFNGRAAGSNERAAGSNDQAAGSNMSENVGTGRVLTGAAYFFTRCDFPVVSAAPPPLAWRSAWPDRLQLQEEPTW